MIPEPEDATLICELPLESSEDLLQQDSESNNESLHKIDIKDQGSDLHTSIEADKLISDEVDARAPFSALEASTSLRSVPLCPPVEGGPATMSSVEASSDHSFAEEREEPSSCIDSVDYMDVDTEAGIEVERCDERPPALDGSIGKTDNKTSVPILVNELAGKPRSTFSPGFLDKPSRKRSSFAEEDHIGGNNAGISRKLNGHCNEYISSSEQVLANSCGNSPSSGSENCNGDMFATSRNGNYYTVNGVTQSSNHSLHADKLDVPVVSHGFEPRPYSEPSSGSSKNCSSTSSRKPLKACQGDMSFLSRGFLGRPSSRGNSVNVADCLPFGNGTSSSLVNGNSKPSNDSRESAVLGTSSDIPMEQKSNGATVVLEHVEERCSDCTINGSSFQLRAASNHLDENSHAILASNNSSCRQENGSNGLNGVGCQRDDTPSMLVSKNSTGSEHDGLRRRVTSKFFEQNGIDAQ